MTLEVPAAAENIAQVDYWNTAAGQTWARYHDDLDRQLAPLGREVLRTLALQAGERVLDVGCGCGHTTLEIAAHVGPPGRAVGVDVSGPMLAVARERAAASGLPTIEFHEADASSLDLSRAPFDAIYSRFGVMFFADPVRAFTNLARGLKTAGRLGFVCWRPLTENPWMLRPLDAGRRFLPELPPTDPTAPGPFAFADADRVRGILEAAGFGEIRIAPLDARIGGGTVEQALELALRVGPLGMALRENPQCKEALSATVREVMQAHLTPEGVLMPAAVWIVTALRAR